MIKILTEKQKQAIEYTRNHRIAFRRVEKLLTGRNTLRSIFHDLDKIILYTFLDPETVHNLHVKLWPHHNPVTDSDFMQEVVDWECARFTKPDKPLNAYDTLCKWYPFHADRVLPILRKFGIAKSGKNWLDHCYCYGDSQNR